MESGQQPSSHAEGHDTAGQSPADGSDKPETPHDHGEQGGMAMRGASRPMTMMGDEGRAEMLEKHHKQTLWVYWSLPLLGFWTLIAPFTFGYLNEAQWVVPSGGRGPWWFEKPSSELLHWQAWLMVVSDVVSGLLLMVFGWRSLKPNRPYSLWLCCFVGVWLTLAPVLFWSPTAAAYLNDSFVGIWVMALTILVPGMPNMIMFMQHGPARPPGWSYNPSSWPQRWIMIATGFLGFVVSRYLATFQLGYSDYVWDPFFSFQGGTEKVLNSDMSRMWPISDGGLGAISYTFEFLMGYMGSASRWRTMPWMVAFFGVLVIPLGLTHIILVISQPVIVHHWCAMCLLAAAIMLPMIPLEVDEVIAMFQHVRQAKTRGDRGGSLWEIFWKGGSAEGCQPDDDAPALAALPDRPLAVFLSSIWGMSFPWTLVAASGCGVALMFAPTLFGLDIHTTAADIGHLGGALLVTVSVICMGEVVRIGRYLNVLLGIAIAALPWWFSDAMGYNLTLSVLAGLALGLSLPRGKVTQTYGAWDGYIR